MAQVSIPPAYFIENIKRQYRNPSEALIREFLQNSLDAGASKVEFLADYNSLICIDNGCGMDEGRLVSALLTMSGSQKEGESIGGFGEAKNLLLFAHASYSIHTKNIHVKGSCLTYDLSYGNERQGTAIRITFHPSFDYNEANFSYTAKQYLATCTFKRGVSVLLNGETVKGITLEDKVGSLDFCEVYNTNGDKNSQYAMIRKGGVTMFSHYVGEGKGQFVVELTKESKEVLSANRDSMNWHYSDNLTKLMNQIVVDRGSFGRLYQKTLVFTGAVAFSIIEELRRKVEHECVIHEVKVQMAALVEQLATVKTVADKQVVLDRMRQVDEEFVSSMSYALDNNFVIDIAKKGVNKLHKDLTPGTMRKKYETMAKLWKLCVKKVLVVAKHDINFNIGWIISDDALAQWKRVGDVHTFQFNPEKEIEGDNKAKVVNMLVSACHEVVHSQGNQYHNEAFSSQFATLTAAVFSDLKSWKEIYDERDNVKL